VVTGLPIACCVILFYTYVFVDCAQAVAVNALRCVLTYLAQCLERAYCDIDPRYKRYTIVFSQRETEIEFCFQSVLAILVNMYK